MAHSKGQAMGKGHSHGPAGHGGHHVVAGDPHGSAHHTDDHMHNSHNKEHAGPAHKSPAGHFPQGTS